MVNYLKYQLITDAILPQDLIGSCDRIAKLSGLVQSIPEPSKQLLFLLGVAIIGAFRQSLRRH